MVSSSPEAFQPNIEMLWTPERRRLIDDAIARIGRASRSDDRSHRLLVGPTGIGKTRLLVEIYTQVRKDPGCGRRFQIAWLPEDPWWITSYEHLLDAILAAIEPTPRGWSGSPEDAVTASAAEAGVIVVLTESFGELLDAIGLNGRRRLRALCENTRPVLFIATSRQVTHSFTDQNEPFYGFFDISHISGVGPEEIANFLGATEAGKMLPRGEQGLAGFVRAFDLYIRGNPRTWLRVAEAINAARPVEWIPRAFFAVVQSLDWVAERVWDLSPSQRSIVAQLGMADRCMTVKEIAGLVNASPQSTAKSLGELRFASWVKPRSGRLTKSVDKRRSYYELADPLVGWAIQTNRRGYEGLLRQLTFLGQWFAFESWWTHTDELVDRIGHRSSLQQSSSPLQPGVRLLALLRAADDALAAAQVGNAEQLLLLPTAVSHAFESASPPMPVATQRARLSRLALRDEASDPMEWVQRAEDALDSSNPWSLWTLARWLERVGHESVASGVWDHLSVALEKSKRGEASAIASEALSEVLTESEGTETSHAIQAIIPFLRPRVASTVEAAGIGNKRFR